MKKKQDKVPASLPNLVVPRAQAKKEIEAQIEKGNRIRDMKILSEEDLEKAKGEQRGWSDYNKDLLISLFDNEYMSDEYCQAAFGRARTVYMTRRSLPPLNLLIEQFKKDMGYHIPALESVLNRLKLISEPEGQLTSDQSMVLGDGIFIVHGHDDAAKLSVARFVEKLGLHEIILHEQPNKGRTIIEKFEDYSNVVFAIVLLTPDDIGYPQNKPEEEKPRARQNVIFELGFFVGKLGRNRVCALHKGDVEILSDFDGVLYVPMGSGNGWKLELAKEMKGAGIEFDLNKAVDNDKS